MSKPTTPSYDAWNPGISSQIPAALLPLVTLYREESSTVSYERAKELADFCGLNTSELICFRAERLVVHDLLVRVTSELYVPDGPNYEDLGISLRSMVSTIYEHHASPQMAQLKVALSEEVDEARAFIDRQLKEQIYSSEINTQPVAERSLLQRLFNTNVKKNKTSASSEPKELSALANWQKQLVTEEVPLNRYCLQALIKVIGALVGHRGRLPRESQLIVDIATNYTSNRIGSDLIASQIEPIFKAAVEKEGYRFLPTQPKPFIMNVKGASASGKSTIRPQQRQLANELGIPWENFALISPDYWRKYLLDYESLGEDSKYAAMLTGQELELIDKKLDRFMAKKAAKGDIPHLLIDRFRFDSFSVDSGSKDSKLLSRFGDQMYLFLMITPPAETVVRAWQRGQTTGRFKAVDDLLHHNIEAFSGMPALFLSWVLSVDTKIRFEFLDNDVPKGDLPRTVAFGSNNSMTILDIEILRNIDRYRQLNIDAKSPEQVLMAVANDQSSDNEFFARCIDTIKQVHLADATTAQVYASFEKGVLVSVDSECLDRQENSEHLKTLLETMGHDLNQVYVVPGQCGGLDGEKKFTLGQWS